MKILTKISIVIPVVFALAVLSSVVALLSTFNVQGIMENMVTMNMASVRAAEELEIALLEQRGYVSFYIQDEGDRSWLEKLESIKPHFMHWLARAEKFSDTDEEREIVRNLRRGYETYDGKRDEAVTLYESGRTEEAISILLADMSEQYDQLYLLCEHLIEVNEKYMNSGIAHGRDRIKRTFLFVGMSIVLTIGIGIGLLAFMMRGIIRPLRQMIREADIFEKGKHQEASGFSPGDELRTIDRHLHTLMSDVTETRSSLEQSRTQLMSAEKMATVGKLAASVAHEIRNPLTSLKMRLFSVQQAIGVDPQFQDDLRVISEEINRLEQIVHNFLEFSRPPALKVQAHDVSLLIEKALELVRHWLTVKNISLMYHKDTKLPLVLADSEQIKQVLINLLRNSIEVLGDGGEISISDAAVVDEEKRQMVVIRIRDNGPGIAEEIRMRIFEPFFSTKEEGTGLGLSIAANIMARHHGRLELESSSPQGTTLALWIPIVEE